jgi:chemotaxis methyl-accepting protein methylase
MSAALTEVARIIQRESGIELKPAQLSSLEAAIGRIDRGLTAEDLLGPAASPQTLERLIDEITIRETFFFRQRSELDAIDWYSTLDAARARGSDVVRVWVAGCASGEEVYTVAILACEAFACASPPVRLLATDIAPTALEQAMGGHYGKRAIRTLPESIRQRYFTTEGETVSVGQRLRALVELRRHNLVRDPIPPSGEQFDVILCRNVLIYFDPPTVERVLKALEGALTPAGMLVLGAADRISRQGHPTSRTRPGGAGGPLPRRTPAPHPKAPANSPKKPSENSQIPPQRATGRDLAGFRTDTKQDVAIAGSEPSTPRGDQFDEAPQHSRPRLADALQAADRGDLGLAIQAAKDALTEDPLNSEAHYLCGIVELARDNASAALDPLRRALYIDPNLSFAAFKLACAHDTLGEAEPARRAYERTLRTLDHSSARRASQASQLDLLDIIAACHARLRALT